MSRICDLIAEKKPRSGNNISHSNRKTRRDFKPNLQVFTLQSEALKRIVRLRLAASTIRTIDKNNGLDSFLLKVKNKKLTTLGKRLKKDIICVKQNTI